MRAAVIGCGGAENLTFTWSRVMIYAIIYPLHERPIDRLHMNRQNQSFF